MLRYARVRFLCRWDGERRIRSSLHWRADLETALKRVACILTRQVCNECIVVERCTYTGLFHPQDFHSNKKYRQGEVPLPFATMFPEEGTTMSDTFSLEVTIVGPWVDRLPYWIIGIERLGKSKNHPYSVRFGEVLTDEGWKVFWDGDQRAIVDKVDAGGPVVPRLGESVTITWIRPVRALRTGRPLTAMNFEDLIFAILRRIKALESYYGKGPVSDFQDLLDKVKDIKCEPKELMWVEDHRFSRRQRRSVSLSGLVGSMVLRGKLEPFGELLALGRDLGVGKGTALGLGRYEILT